MKIKTISPKDFGKDHWSLLAYVETRCVDYGGVLDKAHLRIKESVDRAGNARALQFHGQWKDEYGTRLKGYFLEGDGRDEKRRLSKHDDLNCLSDLEAAGYIKSFGTGLNPAYMMTKEGSLIVAQLRELKAGGGHYYQFELQT